MDLITHLRSFVAVAEARSFTVGAAAVGVPQPVVSRRIQTLEKQLGGDLFIRSARQVRVTDFGRSLLPHAVDLVARADRFAELAATQQDRALRVGIPADADLTAMAAAAAAALDHGFALEVVESPPDARRAQLDSGALHVALVGAAPDTADIAVPLGVGDAAGGPSYPFHSDELRRTRTSRTPPRRLFVCPEDDTPETRRAIGELMARAGLSPTQLVLPGSVAAALTRVHAGDGVVLCPRAFADRYGLGWRPMAGPLRHYAIRTHAPAAWADRARDVLAALAPQLMAAVGGSAPDATGTSSTRSLAPRVQA